MTSIASARVSGGSRPGRRRASIVLPVPGGPWRKRLWPPAAATSSAATSPLWPRTSRQVGLVAGRRRLRGLGGRGRRGARPRGGPRRPLAGARRRVRRASRPAPPRAPASAAAAAGASPCRAAASATASAPRTGRSSPISDSSPTTAQPVTAAASSCPLAAEERDGEREVEARTDLAQVGRREVDRDAAVGEDVAGVRERGAHALARLAHRLVGQADDRERRQPAAQVGLDPHAPRLDAVERERVDPREPHSERAAEVIEPHQPVALVDEHAHRIEAQGEEVRPRRAPPRATRCPCGVPARA